MDFLEHHMGIFLELVKFATELKFLLKENRVLQHVWDNKNLWVNAKHSFQEEDGKGRNWAWEWEEQEE